MRLRAQAPRLGFLTYLLYSTTILATPFALDNDILDSSNGTVVKRCAGVTCGYYGQVCCDAGQICYTDSNNQAQCGSGSGSSSVQAAGSGSGYWQYSTSIYTETDTNVITKVVSSFVGTPAVVAASSTYCPPSGIVTPAVGASPTAVPVSCDSSGGETACGNICCSSNQYCQVAGQCGTAASSVSADSVSAALRPTSSGMSIITQNTISTTTTQPFTPPIATGQSLPVTATSADTSGGLSGGAIAGIVIGVLLALIILTLLCLCLCFKAAWDALVALFGGRKRDRRRRETVEYESYHRSGRDNNRQRTWYGATKPARVERTTTTTKRTTGTFAGGVSGLAVAMGLKKKADDRRRRRDEKSDYSSSSYDYSYSDGSSSDRRTRDTRRSTRR